MQYFAENSCRDLPQVRQIFKQYPDLKWIEDYQSFKLDTMHREKQCIIFAKKRGAWIKPFQAYQQNPDTAYFSLGLAEGCQFDCVYCYLQSYLNNGALVIFVNQEGIAEELQKVEGMNAWISTGILTDSFLAEERYPTVAWLSELLPENTILELRTKSANISILEDPKICRKKIVPAWSLSPKNVATSYEYGTAGSSRRLNAARGAISLGYRIAFHFDPVFHLNDWEKAYDELLKELHQFNADKIAFVSVGLFRYMPDLGSMIRQRFPYHEVLTAEFFPDRDRKYHYLRSIRKEMYARFQEWLEPWKEQVPIYWSMEPDGQLI